LDITAMTARFAAAATVLLWSALQVLSIPAARADSPAAAPPAEAPFSDYRNEAPGRTVHITIADLPAPFATPSATNTGALVPRPADVLPRAPAGFKVNLYADGLSHPRVIRVAPNGDVFVAESSAGRIRVFRGLDAEGKPQRSQVFASDLHSPYGLAFFPAGDHPRWLYVGDTDAVLRIPYQVGDLQASAAPTRIASLPSRGHWTRDLAFSADDKTLYVAVGSRSNLDDPDTNRAEKNRADILAFRPDGSGRRIHASGLRNPAGIGIDPQTGQLWCAVNERDGLGDNLVPDYISSVRAQGFYGWPWWYLGAHPDPRLQAKHKELEQRAIVPDVLLQPHDAPLQITFYRGRQFPPQYFGDIFASSHGSWNRSVRTGYEIIRVPLHQSGHASGDYQDFLTGFVLPDGSVWGTPVGVTVAADGALLVTDDGSNSIWRVQYVGP
jgi:glucose/arabinose dehydrogenase